MKVKCNTIFILKIHIFMYTAQLRTCQK